ncbi:DUF2344 domain-containing protein [Coprothermobacteraceae bacterium]|nr:DUF2344 domain-containing protein [Coprothermobacteraceae bacterium]
MADYGVTIFFRKTGTAAWLSYRDYVRHIAYGLIRSGSPLTFSEGFRHRVALQAPQALPLGVASFGEPFYVSLASPMSVDLGALAHFFTTDEAPVAIENKKWKNYLSVFDTPAGILKVDLEKQSLKQAIESLGVKPWEIVKVALESKDGYTLMLHGRKLS